jgi:predicted phage terminase large subunit-like protein
LLSTVKSRKANPDTPIIVIMQRLAADDPTGFIKGGNLPGEWEFVSIPALIDDEYVETLPEELRDKIARENRDEDGRFSYWPYKEPLADLLEMEEGRGTDAEGGRVSRYVFSSQYQQSPKVLGGDIIRGADFKRYETPPRLQWRKIYADTAQKTAERNDYSVFQCWGLGYDGRVYLLDQIRGKWQAPELRRRAIDFWNKHNISGVNVPTLRKMMIEDKASGTGLIQDIQDAGSIPVEGIEREKDKLTRVMDIVSFIESGLVYIPAHAEWVNDFIEECESFTADDTHAHDDQIDPLVDAINDMLGGLRGLAVWERLGK